MSNAQLRVASHPDGGDTFDTVLETVDGQGNIVDQQELAVFSIVLNQTVGTLIDRHRTVNGDPLIQQAVAGISDRKPSHIQTHQVGFDIAVVRSRRKYNIGTVDIDSTGRNTGHRVINICPAVDRDAISGTGFAHFIDFKSTAESYKSAACGLISETVGSTGTVMYLHERAVINGKIINCDISAQIQSGIAGYIYVIDVR